MDTVISITITKVREKSTILQFLQWTSKHENKSLQGPINNSHMSSLSAPTVTSLTPMSPVKQTLPIARLLSSEPVNISKSY